MLFQPSSELDDTIGGFFWSGVKNKPRNLDMSNAARSRESSPLTILNQTAGSPARASSSGPYMESQSPRTGSNGHSHAFNISKANTNMNGSGNNVGIGIRRGLKLNRSHSHSKWYDCSCSYRRCCLCSLLCIILALFLVSNYHMLTYVNKQNNMNSNHDLVYSLQASLDKANTQIAYLNDVLELKLGAEGQQNHQQQSTLNNVNPNQQELVELLSENKIDELRKKNQNQHRIYCMIPSMWAERKFTAWSAILQTWGRYCDVIKFFLDPVTLPVDGPNGEKLNKLPNKFVDPVSGRTAGLVVVPMVRKNDPVDKNGKPLKRTCWSGGSRNPDGSVKYVVCRHIWEKVWRSWVYVAENDLSSAEWFFKIDDDTFFFPLNMRKWLQQSGWSHKDGHYFGHRLHHGSLLFISGVMVGLSQRTVELASGKYLSMPNEYGDRAKFQRGRCVDRDGATQEITEARCLSQLGIYAETVHDKIHGFEKIALQEIDEAMKFRKREGTSYWLWVGRPKTAICCSIEPVAFHPYKNPDHLIQLYNQLFDRNNTEIRDKFVERSLITNVYKKPGEHNTMGGYFGKYAQMQYLLNVREALLINGFME